MTPQELKEEARIYQQLARRIKEARKEQKIGQEKLSRRIDMSRETVRRLESLDRPVRDLVKDLLEENDEVFSPRLRTLIRVSQATGISLTDLLGP